MLKKLLIILLVVCIALGFKVFSFAEDKLTFGVGVRYLADDFFRGILLGAENRSSQLDIDIVIKDAQLDPLVQLNQIDAFIELGVDAVLLVPQDPRAIVAGIEKLNEEGIPVITIDTEPLGGKSLMYISFDNTAAGESAGKALIMALESKYGKIPEGIVLEIGGDVRHVAEQQRSAGFHNIVDTYEMLEVQKRAADWIPDKAFSVTSDLISRYGEENIIAIYMHADVMAPGVIQALEQADLIYPKDDPDYIIVVALDGGPAGLQLLREEKITHTVLQPGNYYGEFGIQYLYDFLSGKDLPKPGDILEEDGALWSPAKIYDSEIGPQMLLGNIIIGIDIPADSMKLWGNILAEEEGK